MPYFAALSLTRYLVLAFLATLYFVGGQVHANPAPVMVVSTPPALMDQSAPSIPEVLELPGADKGVVIYSSSRWRVLRRVPSGYLDVYVADGDNWRRLELALEWRRNTHPMLAIESPEGLFLVGYDVVSNLPSGRRLEGVREGFDLYLIKATDKGQLKRLAENLQLGGIDSLLYGVVRGQQVDLCGGNRCLTVEPKGKVLTWELGVLAPYDLVELSFRGQAQGAVALVRKKTIEKLDAHSPIPSEPFKLAILTPTGVVLQSLPVSQGTPWGVEWQGDSVVLRIASRAADYRAVLRYDLARMPFSGAMDFGVNNHEGRVAWSQAYYLQGLVSLLQEHPVTDDALNSAVRKRLEAEVDYLARLTSNDYPGLAARRYSIDREALLFALHLGRVAHLLGNVKAAGVSDATMKSALSTLEKKLLTLEDTVERQVLQSAIENNLPTLAYRRGLPFWADGANVPHNYVSGYMSGLLVDGGISGTQRSRQLAKFIVDSEFSGKLPVAWRYWAGTGGSGWQEQSGISLNTPAWVGDRGALAHISYRSMDAVSLAQLERLAPSDVVSQKLIEHFAALTARGWLLPFVNEELRIKDRARPLEVTVARYYSRSAAVWELQSQTAALRDLLANP